MTTALQAQVEELEALAAVYPEDGAVSFDLSEQSALHYATSIVASNTSDGSAATECDHQSCGMQPSDDQPFRGKASSRNGTSSSLRAQTSEMQLQTVPQLSGTLKLPVIEVAGQPVGMRFMLPAEYPQEAAGPARLQVDCACDRAHHEVLSFKVQQAAEECRAVGEGCLVTAAAALDVAVTDLLEKGGLQDAPPAAIKAARVSAAGNNAHHSQVTMCCCVIWFHHIKALSKRKTIVQSAAELRLGGFSKPGFPGVIVCEGLQTDVEEFQQRLRALKWQAMAVRGRELQDYVNGFAAESGRRLAAGFQELPENGMSELAACCRAAGLEALFLSALKINK